MENKFKEKNRDDNKDILNNKSINNIDEKIANPFINNTTTKIRSKKQYYEYLVSYMKNNKKLNIECKDFIKYNKNFYINNNLNKYFKIDDIYLKNCYYKIKKQLYPTNIENVYDYSKVLYNDENFCRYITFKQLISKNNKSIEHKAILLFTDFDIKRFVSSEHILIDGTFIYPEGYMQTIILMYYDYIIDKMIPGIFIIINNKTEEGYIDCFIYIKYYTEKLTSYAKE